MNSESEDPSKSNPYPVGYKKPPKSSQFKAGQSGNPKGRPKGIKNLATDLSEELNEKILVTESGQMIKVTKQRAVIKSMISKSLKGDPRTMNALINLIMGVEQSDQNKSLIDHDVSDNDQQILNAFAQKVLDSSNTQSNDDSSIQGDIR